MERIAALFVIESSVRGQPPEQRLAARVQYARPRLDELKLFLERSLSRISGKARSPEPSATRSHVGTHCCATWRMVVWEMSNNAAERGMRAPVLGRKNYLFCGSDAGGQRAACVYTIVEVGKDVRHQSAGLSCRRSRTHRRSSYPPRSTPCSHGSGHNSPGPEAALKRQCRGRRLTVTGDGPTTLFGLIAVTGMRISEAMGLERDDVDLDAGVLTVRLTKFGKSRLVPLHPTTRTALRDYAHRRDAQLGSHAAARPSSLPNREAACCTSTFIGSSGACRGDRAAAPGDHARATRA